MTTRAFDLQLPVQRHTLQNGLRVVLSADHSAPIICVAVYYHVGMRLEPRGRTGFAHLFEHLMFQGSESMAKMEIAQLVQANGGNLNGSTRYDFTNYFEAMPAHTLDLALWMEADRMRGPVITQAELDNQRDVVKNEIRVNVLNRPYGSFPWIDMQAAAFDNWHNSHNGYGDMADLDAASLTDVQSFFDTYYSPANAVLVVVGDVEEAPALELARRYFEDIPATPRPEPATITEPRQEAERRVSKVDALANKPALAVSYRVPERGSREYYAMGLLDQVLLQGDDSLLYQEIVSRRGYAGGIDGGINFLGHMHNAQTPLLWTAELFHDHDVTADAILEAIDTVIERVRTEPLPQAVMDRALVKARSALYSTINDQSYPGYGRADLLACFELFEGDAAQVNTIEQRFAAVTPDLVMETAREYLRSSNRTILIVEPGVSDAGLIVEPGETE
ncbi:MAG: pitrilysin family protein [Chloroflexi bacterium]|nr:pitrilysin family protein [Chloroflexota bacterium]